MGVTFSDDKNDYKTIFNIFDSRDLFTEIFPFADGAFERYGTDMSVSVSESDKISNAIAELKGRDDYTCVPSDAAEKYRSLFALRFPDRDMLCDMQTITRIYETAEEAEIARTECLLSIGSEKGLGIDDLCTVGEITKESDGKYSYTVNYCGAALLRAYAMILAYGETSYTSAVTLFAEDEIGCAIALLLFENTAGINGGHLLINSYVIAGIQE